LILSLRYLSQIGGITESFLVGFSIGMFLNTFISGLLLAVGLANDMFLWVLRILGFVSWTHKCFNDWDQVFDFESIIKAPNLLLVYPILVWGFLAFTFADSDFRIGAAAIFCYLSLSIAIISFLYANEI